MTAEKRTLKRKPLSDCTNIITDAAASSRRKSSLKSTFAHSHGKSSVQASTASLKSYTSTGSNINTASSVRSSADPPNRSSRPQTRSSHDDLPKSLPSSTQGERQNNQTKMDKGKAVKEDCMIEKSHPSKPSFQQLSSFSASDDDTKSEPSSVQDKSPNDQRKKDKGKAPMVDSTIETSHPSTPRQEKLLFAAIDAFAKSRSSLVSVTQDFTIETSLPSTPSCKKPPSAASDKSQNDQRRKDKGKAPMVDSTIETSHTSTPRQEKLLSAAIDAFAKSRSSSVSVTQDFTIETSLPSTPSCQKPPSAASDGDTKSEPSSIQDKSQNEQRKKDKGKAPMVDSTIDTSHPSTPRQEKLLFAAIDAFAKSRSSPVSVTQDFTIETSLPSTPSCQKLPSAASGTIIPLESKSQTTCNPRKASRNKKQEQKKPTEVFSCPPGKRLKDQLNNESGDEISRLRTDPGPALKKRSRTKRKDVSLHAMPREEVEKLKAYYADIDAFELPVEETGDSDLD